MSFSFPTEFIAEGKVRILVPRLEAFRRKPSDYAPSKAPVFYNPAMELNRDLAVLALQAYQENVKREISVCEPLAGCGVRGVRFAVEVDGIRKVVLNDINLEATRLAIFNAEQNSVADRVSVANEDANLLLSRYAAPRKRFDFIDVDPFGSPVTYIDSAVRALRDGGMLALTATDMAPLCGVHAKACIRKYGGKPLRTEYCHELAVRLLAGCLVMIAAKHEVGVRIVFSHSTDYYVRVYTVASYGAQEADESVEQMGYILHCFKCFHRQISKGMFSVLERKCPECGARMSVAGPLWAGKIEDDRFCELMSRNLMDRCLRLGKRIRGLLDLIRGEVDAPATYYVIDKVCDELGLPVPPTMKVVEELKKAGFVAMRTHFKSRGIKTDAPTKTIKKIVTA